MSTADLDDLDDRMSITINAMIPINSRHINTSKPVTNQVESSTFKNGSIKLKPMLH